MKIQVKTCKGVVYDSSVFKSRNLNPLCIGIPLKEYVALETETNVSKKGSVRELCYACAGWSVFMSRNGGSTDNEGATPQFPRCIGYEVFLYRVVPTAGTASAPANVHSREDHDIRHPETHKPTHAVGDDFLNRFTRNANLVASRVARDMRRVGNNIKNNVEDILFPSRKPPK